jgi:hypothetical protein
LKEYRREQSKIQQAKISTEKKSNNDQKQSSNNKFDNQDRSNNKGAVKVVQSKKRGRESVDSEAVQSLIKNAMSS